MIHHGDCLDVMAAMEPESVDAIVTDPPYGLEFMGKEWDSPTKMVGQASWGGRVTPAMETTPGRGHARGIADVNWLLMQQWHQRWAEAAYRVAKPSAYLLAFGGTRTVHRMTVAFEDAGWIIRDMLVWGYASGFPKSKASLKPAWEPIVMARKPGPLRMLAIDDNPVGRDEWGESTRWPANVVLQWDDAWPALQPFMAIPKADRSDREPVLGGLSGLELGKLDNMGDWPNDAPSKSGGVNRRNLHPTVKPTDLMRHLVRLVTPTGGTVLDPFLGSGTTALAAEMEGFAWIGIEREQEYVRIAEARLNGTQRGLGLEGMMSPDYENLELHTVEAEPPAVDRGLVTWLTIAIAIVAGAAIAALLLATSRAAPGPTSTAPAQPEALPATVPSVAAAAHPVVAAVQAAGTASWYCSTSSACTRGYPASGLFAAAGSEIRAWRGELVRVRSGSRSVVVRLIDVCGCPGRRVIDLYASAFRRLAPTSRGLIPVTVTLERALLLPPTSTAS